MQFTGEAKGQAVAVTVMGPGSAAPIANVKSLSDKAAARID